MRKLRSLTILYCRLGSRVHTSQVKMRALSPLTVLFPGNSSTESALRLAARWVLAVLVLTVMLLRVRRLLRVVMASMG